VSPASAMADDTSPSASSAASSTSTPGCGAVRVAVCAVCSAVRCGALSVECGGGRCQAGPRGRMHHAMACTQRAATHQAWRHRERGAGQSKAKQGNSVARRNAPR
jgi:hypothetical protein